MRRSGGRRRRVACLAIVGAIVVSVAVVGEPVPVEAAPGAPAVPAVPASPPEGSIPDLAAMGWQPVFDQGFGGSNLDTSIWSVGQNDGYTVDGINSADTVTVGGGHAELRTYTDAAGQSHTSSLVTGALGQHTPTWGGFDATYGYVEARMQFPDGPYSNSTFWMMSSNGNNSLPFGDPAADGPELDIMEHGNRPDPDTDESDGDSDGDLNDDGRCDWPSTSTVPCSETYLAGGHWDGFEEDHKPMHSSAVQNPNPSVSLQGNFHTYGMLWTPDEYRYFVDGIEVKRVTAGQTYVPEHLIVSTYVNQGLADYGPLGDPANEVTLVDYVRVWQRPVSDVPDQSTAANTPLAVPFTVQDATYGSTALAEAGSVTVTATSSDPSVVPNSGLVVTGDGPTDPDGSFTNGGFESGLSGWTPTGATVWGTRVHSGTQALRLTQGGSRATQTITGLRPNTTYMVGGHHQIDLGFGDTDGDGRVDPTESFTETGDGTASFDLGITDADAARSGNQEVRTRTGRNGWTEQGWPAAWVGRPWPHDFVKFTTGPTTTSVTLFAENTPYVGTQDDSDVSIDDLYVRAVVSPQRTLAVRPADGAVGDTTITLTARDAAGTTLGSDTFQLSVGAGSLRDGSFEAGEATTPWTYYGTPRLVVPAPFQVDRQLQLAPAGNDTVVQRLTGLEGGTRYRLEVTGHTAQASGDFAGVVQGYDGTSQVAASVSGTATTTQTAEFVTGANTTTADVLLLDWDTADGTSFVEEVKVTRCASTTSCAGVSSSVPTTTPPDLSAVGTQYGVSGVPLTLAAYLPSGATVSGVTSSNELVVPNTNVGVRGSGRRQALFLTPIQDRTGRTTISVAYTGAAGSPVDIPVVVSDRALVQPGFEKGAQHWALSGTATAITTGPHAGAQAMQLNGAGEVRQAVSGLPHGTGYTLRGWVDGAVSVTLRTVPVEGNEQAETLATTTWSGSGWTERSLPFTTLLCTDCTPEQWRPVEVVLADADPGDGQAVKVDDLFLSHDPVVRRTRDISLHSGQTSFGWTTRRSLSVGRVSPNALWDPAVTSVTSEDVPGFGTDVLPAANISGPAVPSDAWPYSWWLDVRAGSTTGRSTVDVTLTDPATGNQVTEPYDVTVNAGNNFNNGDFERSGFSDTGVNTGWSGAWFNDSNGIVAEQGWQYLGIHDTGWTYVGPRSDDRVMRISSGIVQHPITGLTPNTQYTVRLRAKGSGSTVQVRTHANVVFAPILGSVAISPPNADNVWRDYELTFSTTASGNGSTSVVLYVVDADTGDRNGDGVTNGLDAVPASSRYCAVYAAGESCLDDVGVFESADLS